MQTPLLPHLHGQMARQKQLPELQGKVLLLVRTSHLVTVKRDYIDSGISGASMNPARALAPALFSGNVGHLWLYLTAP
ncbi:MAG: hypothetical protein EB828_06630, partial [Nitrosopumilus sp. D6]